MIPDFICIFPHSDLRFIGCGPIGATPVYAAKGNLRKGAGPVFFKERQEIHTITMRFG
ncbi:hypothetical protein NY78_3847 [Desulfovibrio sp. TomC]|nr:hypothetical protein NY78_3847 [Desulfovibrio sp. TomC]